MFRDMRRKKQLLSKDESEEILRRGTSGVLALAGDEGFPYAVPLSYVYEREKIYFHSAVTGHKVDAIAENEKVSFCVIGRDTVIPERLTTFYRSVIVFGRARILYDDEKARRAIGLLAEKYSPAHPDTEREIEGAEHRFYMIELTIEHMTGKQARELIN